MDLPESETFLRKATQSLGKATMGDVPPAVDAIKQDICPIGLAELNS
jgi:hypothetical protein